jgi:hypothetical protein
LRRKGEGAFVARELEGGAGGGSRPIPYVSRGAAPRGFPSTRRPPAGARGSLMRMFTVASADCTVAPVEGSRAVILYLNDVAPALVAGDDDGLTGDGRQGGGRRVRGDRVAGDGLGVRGDGKFG